MIFAGVDFASGPDSTAVCIAQQVRQGDMKVLAIAQSCQVITREAVQTLIGRVMRDLVRPKGYSHSHWRKIYRQSPRMRPVKVVYDRLP